MAKQNNSLNAGIYSAVPQSFSDSESEELQMDPMFSNSKSGNKTVKFDMKWLKDEIQFSKHHSLSTTTNGTRKMSKTRRFFFVLSIIMCFLPIVVFLWVLPCDTNTCPMKVTNWKNGQDVEIFGPINLIRERTNNYNLAVLYKGSINSSDDLKHGAISFIGSTGGVNWYFRQESMPQKMDCSLIDVDNNGMDDCLLLDGMGLKAVNAATGEIVWRNQINDDLTAVQSLEFPVKINDVNRDGVADLLSVFERQYLLVISGKTGKALHKILIHQCNNVEALQVSGSNLQYKCESSYFQIKLSDLDKKIHNDVFQIPFIKNDTVKGYSDDNFIVRDKKVTIKNEGICPDCSSSLELFDKTLKLKVRSWMFSNSYLTKPIKFSFLKLKSGQVYGFILKVWHWPSVQSRIKKVLDPQKHNTTKDFIVNSISERIVLITFNSTSYHIINASETNITQLCMVSHNITDSCQPDIKNQENSLLLADLEKDGIQELISYSTTFYNSKVNSNYQLVSTIKLIKLESELLNLFNKK